MIAILAAILFPVFAKVREKARQTSCLSNLKQIDLAWQQYTTDYDEHANPSYVYYGAGQVEDAWDFRINYTDSAEDAVASVGPGLLDPYIKDGDINQCPDALALAYGRPHSGYSYNATYAGGDVSFGTGAVLVPACTLSQIQVPTRMVLFADSGYINGTSVGADNYMRAPSAIAAAGYSYGLIDFRHTKNANIAYADGHVKSTTAICHQSSTVPELGTLSADDTAYQLAE